MNKALHALIGILSSFALQSMDTAHLDQDEKNKALIETICNRSIDSALRYAQVEALIKSGADIHKSNGFATPLAYAADFDDIPLATLLLTQKRSPVNACLEHTGITPLIKALDEAKPEFVQLYLLYGANANQTDGNQRSPLLIASKKCSHTTVELLIEYGANPDAAFLDWTMTEIARFNSEGGLNCSGYRIFHSELAQQEKLSIADLLTKARMDPKYVILRAAYEGYDKRVSRLLAYMDQEEIDRKYANNRTLLMVAAASGRDKIVNNLLRSGANVTHINTLGQTAYNLALKYNHTKIALLLERYGKALAGEIMTRCFFSNRTSQERLPKDVTSIIGLYIIGGAQ